MKDNHEEIMIKAKANATITGTTAWQSLLNGIPALVFGAKWFTACNSAYLIRSVEECKEALQTILNTGKDKIRRDLLTYLCYYQQYLVKTAYEARDIDLIGLPIDEQIDNYVDAILSSANKSANNTVAKIC